VKPIDMCVIVCYSASQEPKRKGELECKRTAWSAGPRWRSRIPDLSQWKTRSLLRKAYAPGVAPRYSE